MPAQFTRIEIDPKLSTARSTAAATCSSLVTSPSRKMALPPISVFRPRRWRGALLSWEAQLGFEILEHVKRPVSATADHVEIRDVRRVEVAAAPEIEINLLYDPGYGLEERLLREQFAS